MFARRSRNKAANQAAAARAGANSAASNRAATNKAPLPSALNTAKEIASRISGRRPDPVQSSIAPTTALLEQILDEYGLVHTIDDDGDLVVRWEKCNIYFFHYGDRDEVLQARLYLNARYDVDMRPALTVLLDDWNRTKLFPKGYTVLPDDGMVGICAEQAFDFELGASREQVKYAVGSWIHTLLRFADWVEEQV